MTTDATDCATASPRFVPQALLALLAGAMIARLLLAYVIYPCSGYPGDVRSFSQWALAMASHGPSQFYSLTDANYPPGYIYILWIVGSVSQLAARISGGDAQTICASLLKLPPLLLDLGVGVLLFVLMRVRCRNSATTERRGLISSALYLFNPVVLYDSALWGQTDAAGAFIMLLGLLAVVRWPPEIAACIAIISLIVKPQFGVVLIPLTSLALLCRHVLFPQRLAPYSTTSVHPATREWVRIMTSALAAATALYVLIAPFRLGFVSLISHLQATAGQYDVLTVNAFNPWALVSSGSRPPLLLAGIDQVSPDDIRLLGPLSGVSIGTALLAVGFLLGGVRLLWRNDLQSLVLVAAHLCLCFFILPTRVHERYVFPALAFTCFLSALDRKWMWATLLLSVGALINLHAVLSYAGGVTAAGLPFGSLAGSPSGILISISLQTGVFAFATWQLRPAAWRADTNASAEPAMHPGGKARMTVDRR